MLENKDYNADLVFKIVKRGINFEAVVYQRPKYSVEAEIFTIWPSASAPKFLF